MSANAVSQAKKSGSRTVTEIRRIAQELDAARNRDHDFKRAKSIGAELAPMLGEAYWNHPEAFSYPEVRAARKFVSWLKRARYIESPKPTHYRGGSPGLGKRA